MHLVVSEENDTVHLQECVAPCLNWYHGKHRVFIRSDVGEQQMYGIVLWDDQSWHHTNGMRELKYPRQPKQTSLRST
jgi:hypothetical protein